MTEAAAAATPTPAFTGFKPDATPAAIGGAPNPAANGGTPSPSPAAQPEPGSRVIDLNGEKIEVPEELWDKEKASVNAAAAVKRAIDLRKQLGEKPAVPDAYEPKLPEDLAKELDGKWEVPADDPRLADLAAFAKESGLPQEGYSKLLGMYAKAKMAETQQADEAEGKAMAEEWKQLCAQLGGDDGAKRAISELNGWMQSVVKDKDGNIDPGTASTVGYLMNTGPGVMLLLKFRDMMGRSGLPQPATSAGSALTEADLKARVADPRYQTDPAFRAETEAGFKRLYDQK